MRHINEKTRNYNKNGIKNSHLLLLLFTLPFFYNSYRFYVTVYVITSIVIVFTPDNVKHTLYVHVTGPQFRTHLELTIS